MHARKLAVATSSIGKLLPSPPLTALSERRYCPARRHAITLCVCPPSRLYHVSTARRIRLGGEGNALYPMLSSLLCYSNVGVLSTLQCNCDASFVL